MKNSHAITLKKAADKYRDWHLITFKYRPEMHKGGQQDYDDLLSIVGMIERGEDSKKIGRAMWRLDTAVRDVIPDDVYNAFSN